MASLYYQIIYIDWSNEINNLKSACSKRILAFPLAEAQKPNSETGGPIPVTLLLANLNTRNPRYFSPWFWKFLVQYQVSLDHTRQSQFIWAQIAMEKSDPNTWKINGFLTPKTGKVQMIKTRCFFWFHMLNFNGVNPGQKITASLNVTFFFLGW